MVLLADNKLIIIQFHCNTATSVHLPIGHGNFSPITAALKSQDKDCVAHRAGNTYLALQRKSLLHPGVDNSTVKKLRGDEFWWSIKFCFLIWYNFKSVWFNFSIMLFDNQLTKLPAFLAITSSEPGRGGEAHRRGSSLPTSDTPRTWSSCRAREGEWMVVAKAGVWEKWERMVFWL